MNLDMHISRYLTQNLVTEFHHPYVHILFGARQTGKTTLLMDILNPHLAYNFADPEERSRMLAQPGLFRRECEALPVDQSRKTVFIDEAQLVPSVFDAIQVLYDRQPERFRFVLCGSSARKLRESGANLLPGRSLLHRLHPLMLAERPGAGVFVGLAGNFPPMGLNRLCPRRMIWWTAWPTVIYPAFSGLPSNFGSHCCALTPRFISRRRSGGRAT